MECHVETGLFHKSRHQPCEDAAGVRELANASLMAVADGHGARECFRASTGAALAVQIALDCMERFSQGLLLTADFSKPEVRNRMAETLRAEIVDAWRRYVLMDLQKHPVTEEECRKAGTFANLYANPDYAAGIYGTTLVCALLSPRYTVVMQQGDGLCVVLDGGLPFVPVKKDPLCVGNRSTGLADRDAKNRIRHWSMQGLPEAMLLATDGLVDRDKDRGGLDRLLLELLLDKGKPGAGRDDWSLCLYEGNAGPGLSAALEVLRARETVEKLEEAGKKLQGQARVLAQDKVRCSQELAAIRAELARLEEAVRETESQNQELDGKEKELQEKRLQLQEEQEKAEKGLEEKVRAFKKERKESS